MRLKPNGRPNILLVFTDQQSLRAMSCAQQNPWLKTPAMDALARTGTRFLNSYCPSPVCGPSRAAMMTGLMPHQVGVNVNDDPFSLEFLTMGDHFRSAGYNTAYAGKWHLTKGMKFTSGADLRGFHMLPIQADINAKRGSVTDAPTADAAIRFLRNQVPGQPDPFLLVVSLVNPHDICHDIIERKITPLPEGHGPALPQNFPRDAAEPDFITACRKRNYYGSEAIRTLGWSLDDWRGYLHRYYKLIEEVDLQVARITDALQSQGLADNTLVVFTSDHGEGMAAHQWIVKLMLYEEPATVPLIFKLPHHIAPNATIPHLASGIDLLPTLLDYAGAAPSCPLTGRSLKPILDNPSLPSQPLVVCELQPDPKDLSRRGRMLRTPSHKYIAFSHGGNPELLFDMASDPGELSNLALNPTAAPILNHHRQLLAKCVTDTQDPFTPIPQTA